MPEEPSSPVPGSNPEIQKPRLELDPVKVEEFRRRLEEQQALAPAVLGGAAAAVVGAGIWAAVTVATGYQIGWLAVGVGFLVGFTVRFMGKGTTNVFGIAGAALSLIGCLLGNLFSACGFISGQQDIPFWQVVAKLNPELIAEILKATFSPMDLLFYGIAVYEGYKFSFRQVTQEEMQSLMKREAQS